MKIKRSNANLNGRKLEDVFEYLLIERKIRYRKQEKYKGLYGKTSKTDFYLIDYDCAIELKNQTGSGSVWEKIPYAILSLAKFPSKNSVLILGDITSINESKTSWWEISGLGAYNWASSFVKELEKNIGVYHFSNINMFFEELEGNRIYE